VSVEGEPEEKPFPSPLVVLKELSKWEKLASVASLVGIVGLFLYWEQYQLGVQGNVFAYVVALLALGTLALIYLCHVEQFETHKDLLVYAVFGTSGLIIIFALASLIWKIGTVLALLAGIGICVSMYFNITGRAKTEEPAEAEQESKEGGE